MNKQFLHRWKFLSIVFVLMMVLFTGCGTKSEPQSTVVDESADVEVNETNAEQFPVTITDDADREVTIESEPESVISIQASNTEILFALNVGEKVIGVSDYCNYPEEVEDIEKVGGQDMNSELVLSLLPDVVFVTDYHYETHPDILKQYEEAGINVVVTGSANSFNEAYDTIHMIAEATGASTKADELISDMKDRHEALKEKAKEITDKKRVWIEVSPAPDIFTTGKNTFMHEMLETIQAINVAEDQDGWVKLNEEEIVKLDPDVIITTYGYYVDEPAKDVLAREGWAEVPAVKNEQVFDVDNDTVNRPGPRLIEGAESLAELIYPEIFK